MKKTLKWVFIVLLLSAAGAGAYYTSIQGREMETLVVSKGEMRQYVEDTAVVKCRESQTVFIEGAGRIDEVNIDTGDRVKQGDVLLSLDKADLELQLKDATAKIDSVLAQLEGTDIVHYANRINKAGVAVEQAKNLAESARKDSENAKKLYDSGAISKDEYEKIQMAYKTAQSSVDTAMLELEDLKRGTPEYVKEAYRAQLEQSVIYRDTILRNIQKQTVRAPMDGVILERSIERNQMVTPGTAAFVVGNTDTLELEANLLTDDVVKIKNGDEVEISGKAVGNNIIKGRVIRVAPAAKNVLSALGVNQKRVPVTIGLEEGSHLLKPGYNLDIKIVTAAINDAVKVPDSSVFEQKEFQHVFVVENGIAVVRRVKKGMENEQWIHIEEGLSEGDVILVKPDNTVKEGMKVRAAQSK